MTRTLASDAEVSALIDSFEMRGTELFRLSEAAWPGFCYDFHLVLGKVWQDIGFERGRDFLPANSVGVLASVTMTIFSERMICPGVLESLEQFHTGLLRSQFMIIVYGEVEPDDPDDDIAFTLVLVEDRIVAQFDPPEAAAGFGFQAS